MVLVALLLHLVPADDHLQVVAIQERLGLVHPEKVRAPPVLVLLPLGCQLVAGVAPHQVAQPSALRDLLEPVELLDLL